MDPTVATNSTNMVSNKLKRTQEAIEYHDPVNEKIRVYQEQVAAKREEVAAQPVEGATPPKAPEVTQIKEHENTFDVEKRDDGFYVTGQVGKDGEKRTFEKGLFVGTEQPQSIEDKTFMDHMEAGLKGTGKAVKGAFVGLDVGVAKLATNALSTLIDNPVGEYYVGKENIEAFNTFRDWLGSELDKATAEINKDTTAGKVGTMAGELTGQFVAPAVKTFNVLKGLGASPLVATALADLGVAVFGVNPNDKNLADLISDDSKMKPIKDIMGTDPSDPSWVNRARNATEAMLTLGAGEVAAKTLVEGIGRANQLVKEAKIPEKFMGALDALVNRKTVAVGAGAAVLTGDPNEAEANAKTDILEKAIRFLGPVEAGKPIISDEIVTQMKQAASKTGNAVEGIDFNLSHMEKPEEIGELINKVSEVYADPIAKAKRGVQTFDDTQAKADLARATGFDIEAILKRQTGEAWNAEKLKAARDIFVQQNQRTLEMAKAIKAPGGESPEALLAFRRQLAVMSAIQMNIKGAQTEAGRALSQFRMTAKSPLEAKVMVNDIIEKSGGKDFNGNLVDAYINAVENGPPDAAARFARTVNDVTMPDMLFEGWINSLLGSPTTHMVNVTGNALAATQGVAERFGAAAYGAGERTVLRMMGRTPSANGIYQQEAVAYARGMAFSVWDALKAGAKAFKTGEGSDVFGKLDYAPKISSQNVNELPISKAIAGRLGKDELLTTNSPMALFVDNYAEYYMRLPGRFLMAEDEFFKTLTYRSELHAQSAREAMSLGLDEAQAAERRAAILNDPQMEAPDIHINSLKNAREFTFTEQPGEFGQKFSQMLQAGKIGDVPVGRVVVPFFNVINNIMKFVGSRTPGLALLNPRSRTYKDLFSGDPAKRQMVMGKWATGGSIAGLGAWLNQNGICTGRMTDNPKLKKVMEQQGKKAYSCQIQMPDGSTKMVQYNRLEPIGMIMGIAATTSEVLNHVDDEETKQNLVVAATSAILPYMEDKSFFKGAADFFNALWPQYADDDARTKALGDYFIGVASTAPGAVLGPLAPGTPAGRWMRRELAGDETSRMTNPDPYRVVKDQWGDDALTPNDDFEYRAWEGAIKKIMDATPGLSTNLPARTNMWGDDIVMENGVYSSSMLSPISVTKLAYKPEALKKLNLPEPMKNGYFYGMKVGQDLTVDQYKKWVDVVGIDGEMERLGAPVSMPSKNIAAREGNKVIGLPVKLSDKEYNALIEIQNKIKVPNDADPDRRDMTMKEFMNWAVRQEAYAKLPDDADAKGAKADILREISGKYREAAVNIFFDMPENKLLKKRSVLLKAQAQNTGVK